MYRSRALCLGGETPRGRFFSFFFGANLKPVTNIPTVPLGPLEEFLVDGFLFQRQALTPRSRMCLSCYAYLPRQGGEALCAHTLPQRPHSRLDQEV